MKPGDLVKNTWDHHSARCYVDKSCNDWDYYMGKGIALVLDVEKRQNDIDLCKVLVPVGVRYVYSMDVRQCAKAI